ncbi:hypothetical protein [Enterobacter hormaechei]
MKTRLLLCAGLFAASSAHASALYFYEAGTEDTALDVRHLPESF